MRGLMACAVLAGVLALTMCGDCVEAQGWPPAAASQYHVGVEGVVVGEASGEMTFADEVTGPLTLNDLVTSAEDVSPDRIAGDLIDDGLLDPGVIGPGLTDAQVGDEITVSGGGGVDPDALDGDGVDDDLVDSSIIGVGLNDAQVSDEITVSDGGSVDPDALMGDGVDDDLVDSSIISGGITDAQVGDDITVGSGGSVSDAALSGNVGLLNVAETITENWVNTSNPWSDAEVANDLTVSGGSVDGSPVGGTTPSTGAFTALSVSATAEVNGTLLLGDGSAIPVVLYLNDSPSNYWTGSTIGWVADPSVLDGVSGQIYIDGDESSIGGYARVAKITIASALDTYLELINGGGGGFGLGIGDGIALITPGNGDQPYMQIVTGPIMAPNNNSSNPNGHEIRANTIDGSFDLGQVMDFSINKPSPTFVYHQEDEAGAYSEVLAGFGSDEITEDLLVFDSPTRLGLAGNYGTLSIVESPEASGNFFFTLVSTGDGAELFLQSSTPAGTYEGAYTSAADVFAAASISGAARIRAFEDEVQFYWEDFGEDYEDLYMVVDASSAEIAIGGAMSSREWDFDVDDGLLFIDASEDTVDVAGDFEETIAWSRSFSGFSGIIENPFAGGGSTGHVYVTKVSGTGSGGFYMRYRGGYDPDIGGVDLGDLEPGTIIDGWWIEAATEDGSVSTADVWVGLFYEDDIGSSGHNTSTQVGSNATISDATNSTSGTSYAEVTGQSRTVAAGQSFSLVIGANGTSGGADAVRIYNVGIHILKNG